MISPPPRGGVDWNGTGYSVVTSNPKVLAVRNNKGLFLHCVHHWWLGPPLIVAMQIPTLTEGLSAGCTVIPSLTLEVMHISLLGAHWLELPTWPQWTTRETGSTLQSRDRNYLANNSNDVRRVKESSRMNDINVIFVARSRWCLVGMIRREMASRLCVGFHLDSVSRWSRIHFKLPFVPGVREGSGLQLFTFLRKKVQFYGTICPEDFPFFTGLLWITNLPTHLHIGWVSTQDLGFCFCFSFPSGSWMFPSLSNMSYIHDHYGFCLL